MRHIFIVDAVEERDYTVLFRQGDLDGACVIYSLMMGLNLCGYVDDETSFADEPDRRTQLGKLYKQFEDYPALFSGGACITDLQEVVDKAYGRKIKTEFYEGKNKGIIDFTVGHLYDGHPVILGMRMNNGAGHAIIACGLEFEHADEDFPDGDGHLPAPHKILSLDPNGCQMLSFHLWNSFILHKPQKGTYPYLFVGGYGTSKVKFDEALALWSR